MKNNKIEGFNELKLEIRKSIFFYKKYYKIKLTESIDIVEYWANEFYGWKIEAYEDILELILK